jgi:alpha-L-fucosidase
VGDANLKRREFLVAGAAAAASVAFGRGATQRMPTPRPVPTAQPVPALQAVPALQPAARPTPTPAQLTWQRDELAMFLHFGVNTFTDREWGDGGEDPAVFAPSRLDAGQWARAARAAGFRAMVLTAKHHDGFCLWPTVTTRHSVASSPWRGGQGDLVGEFVDACRAESLGAGLYLSPWDRNAPVYGDSPRYNDFYIDQLTELLTRYGPIREVWFDGANGEGPNGRTQVYDWPRIWATVRGLQPEAVIFSDAGPDVRWIGNERGVAGETNWSTVDPDVVPYPGATGPRVMDMLQHGDPDGTVWRPGETDVSIRPGWFYHPAEDASVRTVDDLVGLYFTSVGRNSKLLLNVPPTRDGLLHDIDIARINGMHRALGDTFATDLAADARTSWRLTGSASAVAELELVSPARISIVDLREDITAGQRVGRYRVEAETGAGWQTLSEGTTIGYCKLDRVAPVVAGRVRVSILDSVDRPLPVTVGLYGAA